ncbi:glutamate decarboxylase [Meredithblackwellia eburnea MCA 4105]
MVLSRNINPEKILKAAQEHAARTGKVNVHTLVEREDPLSHESNPRYDTAPIPKHSIPTKSTDAKIAYELIHDELSLDSQPILNLASFVHTHMPEEADKLMAENVGKNLIDSSEYPATQIIVERCVSILAKLWNADEKLNATGTPTTGSSEAIQLCGLAMKRLWQERMRKAGKDEYRPGPNVIMGANAQVALEKFARYFDVECRLVPVDASTNYCLSPERAMQYVDENTIGVFIIMGSTYTGHFEDVEGMAKLLDEYEAKTGISVPIHVDGASGAFVAPFAYPDLKWDFRIPRVVSINTSGHKWGKTYVGCGWAIWRDSKHLPKDMVFELHYLGSIEYSFSLNFSRPAAPIIAQYFNFIHLGFEGYRRIALHDAKNARLLSRAIEKTKYYDVVSSVHTPVQKTIAGKAAQAVGLSSDISAYVPALPVVAFKFSAEFQKEYPHVKQKWIQTLLRAKQWVVPNYELPPNAQDTEILRVVVREQMTEDLVERLIIDLVEITESLMNEDGIVGFHKAGSNAVEQQKKHHQDPARKAASHGEGVKATGHASVC